MYQLKVKSHIDAAHYIKDYKGKCQRMHGHRWEIEIVLEGSDLNEMNMLVDFSVVKDSLKHVLENLDHYVLNEQLGEPNVTAEFLSKWLYDQMQRRLDDESSRLSEVSVWESPDCCITYKGE